jgi:hypothetical protein
MQFFGQFGTVHGAHAGIEILWFVKVVDEAPVGGTVQPALFPERCIPASAPMAASPFAVPALASLDVAPLVAPLALPAPDEPPPSSLAGAAPLALLDPDSPPNPELKPALPLPLPIPDPSAAPAAPRLASSATVPLVPLSAGLGPVWLALQAATTRTAQQNGPANPRLMSASVGVGPGCDHLYEAVEGHGAE